jgi:hypothetical protein
LIVGRARLVLPLPIIRCDCAVSMRVPGRGEDARDLIVQYTWAAGGPDRITEGQLADIVRAAELVALAEEARFAALTKGGANLLESARIEGCADRAVRRLNLGRPREQAAPDLKSYLVALADKPDDEGRA